MPAIEPKLLADDIQGNILPGFRRAQQCLVGFQGEDPAVLRAALDVLHGLLTDLATVLDHKDQRKLAFLASTEPPRSADLWVNYALGPRATDALGLPQLKVLETAFSAGMVPSRTGDADNPLLAGGGQNPAAPANWVVGGPNRPLDLLVIFAADTDIETLAQSLVGRLEGCGLRRIYTELGALLPGDAEHFGFQDGISQPGVRGTVKIGTTRRFVTTRYGVPSAHGVDFGKPGQPLQDPFQFLFDASDPALSNGAFLVFRRLTQEVGRFRADTTKMAAQLQAIEPGLDGEALRARIVGRWPSGQPLMRPSAPPHAAEPAMALNHFAFGRDTPGLVLSSGETVSGVGGDPDVASGGRCPVWAHIRKVNPRDLQTDKGGPDETAGFQMLRRGIPFGPLFDHADPTAASNAKPRGLLFLAYQRSITDQFETLNSNWMNNSGAPAAFGFDLLVGQRLDADGRHSTKDADFFNLQTQTTLRFSSLAQWVTPTGGGYLFAPSISWTRKHASATQPPPPAETKPA